MKSLSDINTVIQTYVKLPIGIEFSYSSGTPNPASLLRPDDDTAYYVGLFFIRNGEKYNQGVIIYPWESTETILKKMNETISDLEGRMRRIA